MAHFEEQVRCSRTRKKEGTGIPDIGLSNLANLHAHLSDRLKEAEELASKLKKRLFLVESESIPAIMEEIGLATYSMNDGAKIEIKDVIKGSIPTYTGIQKAKGEQKDNLTERRMDALAWLREHGGASIIKNKFIFDLGKDSSEVLNTLKEFAEDTKLPWQNDETVHGATLNSFLKDKMAVGEDIPFETFSLFVGKVAKITQPKN